MAKHTTSPSSVRNTQAAATEVPCHQNTLTNYVRDGLVNPLRTPSGRLCWFDEHIAKAREVFQRNTQRP